MPRPHKSRHQSGGWPGAAARLALRLRQQPAQARHLLLRRRVVQAGPPACARRRPRAGRRLCGGARVGGACMGAPG